MTTKLINQTSGTQLGSTDPMCSPDTLELFKKLDAERLPDSIETIQLFNVPSGFFDSTTQIIPIPKHKNSQDVTDNKTRSFHDKPPFIFIMKDDFHREDERLKTFENWPHDFLSKKILAETGMFYTGQQDQVKCYFCEVEIGVWQPEDQPVSEHLRWSPNCPLLRRRTTNNVPISAMELDSLLPPISYDVCGANSSFESSQSGHEEYREYAIETVRIRSFAEWPRHMKQTPSQMAEAGFFYSGVGDRVKCFSCGGGLKDWDPTDDPWEQHALWLPKCRYLKLVKGQNFIDSVIAKQMNVNENPQNKNTETPICSTQVPTGETTVLAAFESSATGLSNPSKTNNLKQTDCTEKRSSSKLTDSAALAASSDLKCDAISTNSERAQPTTNNIPEEKLCKICYANEYNTAFLPCGHVVACAKCASSVKNCPVCRKPFKDVTRVYFS